MSLGDFQSIDNETKDNSFICRDFLKVYRQQEANLNDSDQKFEFILGENKNYHQIGNHYLQDEMTIEKDVANAADRVPVGGDVV